MTSAATMALMAALQWHNIAVLYRNDAYGQSMLSQLQGVSPTAVNIITSQPLTVDGSGDTGNITSSIVLTTGTPVIVLIQFGSNLKNSVISIRATMDGSDMGLVSMATISR